MSYWYGSAYNNIGLIGIYKNNKTIEREKRIDGVDHPWYHFAKCLLADKRTKYSIDV